PCSPRSGGTTMPEKKYREHESKVATTIFTKEEVLAALGIDPVPGWRLAIGIFESSGNAVGYPNEPSRPWQLVVTQAHDRSSDGLTPHQRGLMDVDETGRWPIFGQD